tara:strand:+ start:71 stop:175 length:105 start_codon:yes stop_codon:yes gene_type:complete
MRPPNPQKLIPKSKKKNSPVLKTEIPKKEIKNEF